MPPFYRWWLRWCFAAVNAFEFLLHFLFRIQQAHPLGCWPEWPLVHQSTKWRQNNQTQKLMTDGKDGQKRDDNNNNNNISEATKTREKKSVDLSRGWAWHSINSAGAWQLSDCNVRKYFLSGCIGSAEWDWLTELFVITTCSSLMQTHASLSKLSNVAVWRKTARKLIFVNKFSD